MEPRTLHPQVLSYRAGPAGQQLFDVLHTHGFDIVLPTAGGDEGF
jgi:hypothetical protein